MPELAALQVQQPNALNTIGSMMDIANKAQSFKSGGIDIQQKQGALDARREIAKVMGDPQYRDPETGDVDIDKISGAIRQADKSDYIASHIIGGLADSKSKNVSLKKLQQEFHTTNWNQAATGLGALIPRIVKDPDADPVKLVHGMLTDMLVAKIISPMVAGQMFMSFPVRGDKAEQVAWIKDHQQSAEAVGNQIGRQNQPPAAIGTGGTTRFVQTNPLDAGNQPPGALVNTLPPTQTRFNNQTNAMETVGAPAPEMVAPPAVAPPAGPMPATPTGAPMRGGQTGTLAAAQLAESLNTEAPLSAAFRARTAPRPGPVQTSPALGQEGGVLGTVASVNNDWEKTRQSAETAQQDIGVLQNIKKFARGAVTGVGQERRAFLTGLAGLIGMDVAQMEKTNTDLLAKNSNMLALAGGDTNLARTMAEAANPNPHMTPEAIEDAANQVIAQRKLAVAKQKFLAPFKNANDPAKYNEALSQFNQVGDARILQLDSMSKDEKQRMKAAMSPRERAEFSEKIRRMHAMGLVGE